MRVRAFKILYLTAIIVAMLGWIWILIQSFTWASPSRGCDAVPRPDKRQTSARAPKSLWQLRSPSCSLPGDGRLADFVQTCDSRNENSLCTATAEPRYCFRLHSSVVPPDYNETKGPCVLIYNPLAIVNAPSAPAGRSEREQHLGRVSGKPGCRALTRKSLE
jgi:hypothetical protein